MFESVFEFFAELVDRIRSGSLDHFVIFCHVDDVSLAMSARRELMADQDSDVPVRIVSSAESLSAEKFSLDIVPGVLAVLEVRTRGLRTTVFQQGG